MRIYTGSTNCDDRGKKGNSKGKIMVNLLENVRDPEEIQRLNDQCIANGKPPKYDISKANLNIYYETCKTEEEAFEYVFGESMERYNNGQKRNDRKTSMEKELAKLEKGKVQQELIHCLVAQVGNHDNHPPTDECIEMLNEYYAKFKEKFPNMKIISAAIHVDEQEDGTIHLQMYFIPVKTKEQHEAMGSRKKWSGMDIQPSLTGALEQMGYSNDAKITLEDGRQVHDYKNGAMAQWQRDFNGLLDGICLNHDIAIDHYMRGQKVTHQDTYDYYSGITHKDIAKAKHDKYIAESNLSEAILNVENTMEESAKLRKENDALKMERNAIQSEIKTLKESVHDIETTIEKSEKMAQKNALRKADEYIAYYKRARVQIEKDPAVYKAFESARKMTKRTQNAWAKYRNSYTSFGRRHWAQTAIKLQQQSNEVWQEAKEIAEAAKYEAALKRKKAEIKKEVDDLLKPHISDFKNFCKVYDALSAEKQAKYKSQFEEIRKKNKGDIKDMGKHLTRIFGKQTMEYDKIKEVQEDRRKMNKLTNRMLQDIQQGTATGDFYSLDDAEALLAAADKMEQGARAKKTAKTDWAVEEDVESLMADDDMEL